MDKRLMASTSLRSDNRSAIKEMHSLAARGGPIKRFHAGTPLRVKNFQAKALAVPHSKLTSCRKFAEHVDAV